MSPSWNNRLFVAISPARISMLMLRRGLKPKVLAQYDETFNPIAKQPTCESALNRLTQLLAQPEWQKAEVNIVLSNQLSRFELINFAPQLKQYAAQEAFARYALNQTYGTVTDHWTLRIQSDKKNMLRLVSAVDQTLLHGLQQACATHQLKLKRVTPYLTSVFNHFHKQLHNETAWLVIHEAGYSLLALLSAGQFVAINGVYHDTIDELPLLLDRENLLSTLPETCTKVYLFAPALTKLSAIPKSQYQFSKLELAVPEGFPAQTEGLYAMLMSECL